MKDFGIILIFIILSIVFIFASLIIAKLIRPSRWTSEKMLSYECGEDPEGDAWVQYNFRYYIYAILFLIFDVEVVFLFPWAVVFKNLKWLAFIDITLFILILLIPYIYLFIKGDLEWFKKIDEEVK